MACSLNICLKLSGFNDITLTSIVFGFCPSFGRSKIGESKPKTLLDLKSDFVAKPLVLSNGKGIRQRSTKAPGNFSVNAQESICGSRARRWWEKTLETNMVEIHSAQELVDSLLNAGDRLVVVDFYSPGCGGCRALHHKICQLAESNQNAIFLKVNYEGLKTMCRALHVHVLPFFRLYRGAKGRLCSFSCTNSTIKKLKDALAKYGADQLNFAPAKGVDESEILKLAAIGELPVDSPLQQPRKRKWGTCLLETPDLPATWSDAGRMTELKEETAIL